MNFAFSVMSSVSPSIHSVFYLFSVCLLSFPPTLLFSVFLHVLSSRCDEGGAIYRTRLHIFHTVGRAGLNLQNCVCIRLLRPQIQIFPCTLSCPLSTFQTSLVLSSDRPFNVWWVYFAFFFKPLHLHKCPCNHNINYRC